MREQLKAEGEQLEVTHEQQNSEVERLEPMPEQLNAESELLEVADRLSPHRLLTSMTVTLSEPPPSSAASIR